MLYMSKTEKLLEKLKRGSISAPELRTLLKKMGAELINIEGSHERYYLGARRFSLAVHGKDLKRYQVKQAMEFLGVKDE